MSSSQAMLGGSSRLTTYLPLFFSSSPTSVCVMSKKYQLVRERVQSPESGFVEAIRVALVEFACLGERRFDITGYPYEGEDEAFLEDWRALGTDARSAFRSVAHEHKGWGESTHGEVSPREPASD